MSNLQDVQRYWNQGIDNVPWMTGASSLMDCADIKEHAEKLDFTLPFRDVLDVGCGTGRLSRFVSGRYVGVDVSSDAVEYCRDRGLSVFRIDGPYDLCLWLGLDRYDWITCLSVFTHIDAKERRIFLQEFIGYAPNLLIDIIPGDGLGSIELWTADWDLFQQDLTDTGWQIKSWYDRVGPSGPMHRYVWAVRA